MTATPTRPGTGLAAPVPAGAVRRPRRSGATLTTRPLTGMLLVAPTAIIVALLFVVPLVILLVMSLTDWPLLGSPRFTGTDNYTGIADNQLFLGAIGFTLLYTAITTVVVFGVSFLLVAISNADRRGSVLYRTAFFLPYVVGTAAAALLWFVDVNDQLGIFVHVLRSLGLVGDSPGLLATPGKALATTVLLVVWKFIGFQVVVLLVGLQSVPGELYEAARVDGANTWVRLRYITLPYLRPTLALLLMLSITGSLLAFDQFIVLTGGGPDNSTVTLVMAIYNTAFSGFRLGSAAALSVVLLVALVALNVVQLRLLREKES